MTILTRGRVVAAVCLALLCFNSAVYIRAQTQADYTDTSAPKAELASSSLDSPDDAPTADSVSRTGVVREPSEVSTPVARPSSSLDLPVDSTGAAAVSGSGIVAVSPASQQEHGIAWGGVFKSSLAFLAVEHTFRYATEYGTRDAFHTPFWPGYFDSVENLHGWADGDPFLVNYVGHPMQGAVAGFIWQHNDRAFRTVEFGKNRRYWKGKLRGAAFAYFYSLQFEIGPLSEASLGHIQAFFPQTGFVDQVITPSVGLAWTLAEDSIDRYVIRAIEAHTRNPYLRMVARGGLNPSRSFANVLTGELPWHRDDRPGVFKPYPEAAAVKAFMEQATESKPAHPPEGVAPFEFTITPNYRAYVGTDAKGSCIGGGGTGAIRIAAAWQIVVDLNGCKLLDLPTNLSGDSFSYMVGPRWTPSTSGRWTPHAQVLVGGTKLTQELLYPELKEEIIAATPKADQGYPLHHLYTKNWDTNGFAIAAGTGVDYRINNALALRVASLEYSHSWTQDLNGVNYQNGLQFSTGLVLRMGTW
jgi:hypothetical protein